MFTSGKVRAASACLLLVITTMIGLAGVASADPPGIPTETTARSDLAALTVKADGSQAGYSRDKFPHWITIEGSCDTREEVLKRDGDNVETSSTCSATAGSWYSPYDGETWTSASDVDIDHIVPLADAWRTGASGWTTAQRQAFANDLDDPQLIAVTDNVNQSKGDQSPDTWKPPSTAYWCTYAKMWVHIKHKFDLSINSAEKSALEDMLDRC